LRTFYQSPEYENVAVPGTFAALLIIGDDDGPHFVFVSGDQCIADVPVPCGVALEMSYALGRSAHHAIRMAEHMTDDWETDEDPGRHAEVPRAEHQHVEHHAQPSVLAGPVPALTYGPREIPPGGYPPRGLPAGADQRGPEPAEIPIDHTRPLPVCPSGSRLRRTG
jgi:hypothetical protein